MAVHLCSEPFDASPRISFSHDLRVKGIIPVDQTSFGLVSPGSNPSFDFDFDFDSCGFDRPCWSPADELFSEGKMIPLLQIKKHLEDANFNFITPKKDHHKGGEEKEASKNCEHRNKSFWRFGRSSSLNSSGGGGYSRMGLCPLPLLSRSNSTGSTLVPRMNKHSIQKQFQPRDLDTRNNVWFQKPPLRRASKGVGRHAVRVDPVLNVIAPGNMFGLCSVFGRDKRKRK